MATVRLRKASEYPDAAQKLFELSKGWFNYDFPEPRRMILVDWRAIVGKSIQDARGLFRYVMPHVSLIQSLILVFPCPKAVVCLNVRRLVKIREGLCGGIAMRARSGAKSSPGLFAAG